MLDGDVNNIDLKSGGLIEIKKDSFDSFKKAVLVRMRSMLMRRKSEEESEETKKKKDHKEIDLPYQNMFLEDKPSLFKLKPGKDSIRIGRVIEAIGCMFLEDFHNVSLFGVYPWARAISPNKNLEGFDGFGIQNKCNRNRLWLLEAKGASNKKTLSSGISKEINKLQEGKVMDLPTLQQKILSKIEGQQTMYQEEINRKTILKIIDAKIEAVKNKRRTDVIRLFGFFSSSDVTEKIGYKFEDKFKDWSARRRNFRFPEIMEVSKWIYEELYTDISS